MLPLWASRVVAVKVIYFGSVLFCCITDDQYLFQAGFWFICMSRSDAVLVAGVSHAELRPSRWASSSPGALQKHAGEHNLSVRLTFTDIPSGTVRLGKKKVLIPFPMCATLLEVGAAKPVLTIALLGHRVGAAAARSSQILIAENSWIYHSSCTQRKEDKLHLQTSDTKETRHFWSQCLQIAEFSLDLLLRSIQVLQGPYQRLVLLLLPRSVWTRDHRNKAEKVF